MKQILEIESISDLGKVATVIKPLLKVSKNIILLNGDLGSGKTTLVIEYCKQFDLQATSPTFSLIQDYKNEKIKIAHVDLYRLNNYSEVDSSGFWDLFSQDYSIVFIEWSEKIDINELPLNWNIISLNMRKVADSQREIVITKD